MCVCINSLASRNIHLFDAVERERKLGLNHSRSCVPFTLLGYTSNAETRISLKSNAMPHPELRVLLVLQSLNIFLETGSALMATYPHES